MRTEGPVRDVKGCIPLYQLYKLGRAMTFEIGFVQYFLGHRGHLASVPRNRILKLLRMTDCPQSSRGDDFIEYLLCDSPNVDMECGQAKSPA